MLQVGITGGMGSGKSTICRVFAQFGIPVYDADSEAKKLMLGSRIKAGLSKAFGAEIYTSGGEPNRPLLSAMVFNDKEKLMLLNSIVHPEVFAHYHSWVKKQKAPYTIKEAALLFESGSYRELDKVISVYAPLELRIQRIKEREKSTEEQIRARIKNQLSEKERNRLADIIIKNDEKTLVIPRVLKLHKQFLKISS
jgi:dephospho-CoA kinase